MALGLGLSSVAFFGVVGGTGPAAHGAGAAAALGLLRRRDDPRPVVDLRRPGLVFGLLFLLPRRSRAQEAAERAEPAAPEGGLRARNSGSRPGLLKARTRLPKARPPGLVVRSGAGGPDRGGRPGAGLRPEPAGARQPSAPRPRRCVKTAPLPYRSRPPACHTGRVSMIHNLRKAVRLPSARHRGVDLSHPARSPLGTAVVNCAVYVDGVRQIGDRPADEAIAAGPQNRQGLRLDRAARADRGANSPVSPSEFGLHPLAVEDAVHAHQRPKLERYDDTLFTVFKTIHYVEHAELTATSEVVETGEVMCLHRPGLRHHRPARRPGLAAARCGTGCRTTPSCSPRARRPCCTPSPTRSSTATSRSPTPCRTTSTRSRSRSSPARGRAPAGRDAGRIYQLKREVLEFKRAVSPLLRPMQLLSERPMRLVDPDIQKYFRDVADHLARVNEQVLGFDELLNSILQANLAQAPSRRTRTCARSPPGRRSSPCRR